MFVESADRLCYSIYVPNLLRILINSKRVFIYLINVGKLVLNKSADKLYKSIYVSDFLKSHVFLFYLQFMC